MHRHTVCMSHCTCFLNNTLSCKVVGVCYSDRTDCVNPTHLHSLLVYLYTTQIVQLLEEMTEKRLLYKFESNKPIGSFMVKLYWQHFLNAYNAALFPTVHAFWIIFYFLSWRWNWERWGRGGERGRFEKHCPSLQYVSLWSETTVGRKGPDLTEKVTLTSVMPIIICDIGIDRCLQYRWHISVKFSPIADNGNRCRTFLCYNKATSFYLR